MIILSYPKNKNQCKWVPQFINVRMWSFRTESLVFSFLSETILELFLHVFLHFLLHRLLFLHRGFGSLTLFSKRTPFLFRLCIADLFNHVHFIGIQRGERSILTGLGIDFEIIEDRNFVGKNNGIVIFAHPRGLPSILHILNLELFQ